MAAKDRRDDEDVSFDPEMDLTPEELDGIEFEAEGGREGIGRRTEPHPADREHGLKTRARSKQIVSGQPYSR